MGRVTDSNARHERDQQAIGLTTTPCDCEDGLSVPPYAAEVVEGLANDAWHLTSCCEHMATFRVGGGMQVHLALHEPGPDADERADQIALQVAQFFHRGRSS